MTTWSIERKTLAGLVVAVATLAIMSVVSFRAIHTRQESSASLAKAQQLVLVMNQLHADLADITAAQGAFMLTGDARLWDQRVKGFARLRAKLEKLRASFAGSPASATLLGELHRLIDEQMRLLDQAGTPDPVTGQPATQNVAALIDAQQSMRAVNSKLADMAGAQEDSIERIRALDNQAARMVNIVQMLVLSLALVVLLWLALRIRADLNERRRSEVLLLEANRFMESLIENLPAMILVKKATDHKLLRVNKAAEELLGLPREVLLGKTESELFPRKGADHLHKQDNDTLAQRKVVDIPEEEVDTRVLGRRILHTRKFPVEDASGQPSLLIGISMDITESKAAERRILALNAELERNARLLQASNKELESFCYSVSHDLRAPLRTIDGYAQALEEEQGHSLNAAGLHYLHSIRHRGKRMNQLIDDLLAYARISRQPVAPVEIDMMSMASKAAEIVAFGRKPPAEIEILPLPAVRGDAGMMQHVWMNLLDNAIKYSAKRTDPHVSISAHQEQQYVIFSVKDNGVGFNMEQYDKLFGVFQRLHAENEFSGTGVGLAIVDRIVSRHGGRVWAESKLNEGATFYFSLPAADA